MSTPRRLLGTGPNTTSSTAAPGAGTRLLPVEQLVVDEHQEDAVPRARQAGGPVPGRRALGDRGQ
ncbi:hypothetical protein ACH4OQ_38470 [Streptomyces luteogriseus]|uniref:hypothetical protein n=1 Tax=Streptomyces luteogriseus TaxID=68233 RepID=UPI003788D95C